MPAQTHDFAHRLSRVLEVAEKAIRVLIVEDRPPPGESDEPDEPRPEKVMAETALLLLFAERVHASHTHVHEQVHTLAEQLVPHARAQNVVAGMTFAPALALEYATAHACLSRLGYLDPAFDNALTAALASPAARTRERVPYRQLELEWLRSVWEPGSIDMDSNADLAARTTAGMGLDSFSGTRDDIYAYTHSLIYLTDFGRRAAKLPRTTTELLADAEAALARCLDDDDFDLAGELLLTWPLLAAESSPASRFAFDVLTRVEDEVGYLPSLSLREDRYRELQGMARTRYTIGEAYHTIYVMGLLCAATLQSGSPRPGGILPTCSATGASAALLEHLAPTQREPQWRHDFDELEPDQQDALAPFVATAALHRAIESGDLSGIREVLSICVEEELAPSTAMLQAADFLQRAAASPYAAIAADPG